MTSLNELHADVTQLQHAVQSLAPVLAADEQQVLRQKLRHVEQVQRRAVEAMSSARTKKVAAATDYKVQGFIVFSNLPSFYCITHIHVRAF